MPWSDSRCACDSQRWSMAFCSERATLRTWPDPQNLNGFSQHYYLGASCLTSCGWPALNLFAERNLVPPRASCCFSSDQFPFCYSFVVAFDKHGEEQIVQEGKQKIFQGGEEGERARTHFWIFVASIHFRSSWRRRKRRRRRNRRRPRSQRRSLRYPVRLFSISIFIRCCSFFLSRIQIQLLTTFASLLIIVAQQFVIGRGIFIFVIVLLWVREEACTQEVKEGSEERVLLVLFILWLFLWRRA